MADRPPSSTTPKAKVFKTRAGIVRKTQAEREEYAKQEAERAAARATAAVHANAGSTSQSKQTDRRTRDGKQKEGHAPVVVGSGVFGAGVGGGSTLSRRKQDAGKSEMLEGQEASLAADVSKVNDASRQDATPTATGSGSRRIGTTTLRNVDNENPYDAEPDIDEGPKRDIEQICISSDEETVDEDDGGVITSKGRSRELYAKPVSSGIGLRPVRAVRTSTDHAGGSLSTKGSQKQSRNNRVAHYDSDMADEDRDEMVVNNDEMEGVRPQPKQDVPSSPELGRRKPNKRQSARTKDPRVAIETAEERAERGRLDEDICKMAEEFVDRPRLLKALKQGVSSESESINGSGDGRLLLFQFPPIVPFLADANAAGDMKPPAQVIKTEPGTSTGANQLEEDLPEGQLPQARPQAETYLTASDTTSLPSGRVGKLRVHKSGKVTLDWGGTDMELRHGTDVDFLQDAILVERPPPAPSDDESGQTKEPRSGCVYALGQIQRKLVAIPDWQKLYD